MNFRFISRIPVDGKHIYQLREFKEGVTEAILRQEVEALGLPQDNQQDMINRMHAYNKIMLNQSILLAESENIDDFADHSVPGVDTYKKNIQAQKDPVQ